MHRWTNEVTRGNKHLGKLGNPAINPCIITLTRGYISQAALELVADLMENSKVCLKEGLQHLTCLHFQQEPFADSEFNLSGLSITR